MAHVFVLAITPEHGEQPGIALSRKVRNGRPITTVEYRTWAPGVERRHCIELPDAAVRLITADEWELAVHLARRPDPYSHPPLRRRTGET